MWSITTTHPILRIFVYQYEASLSVIGSQPPCDRVGSGCPKPHRTLDTVRIGLPTVTKGYQRRVCDECSDSVGLVSASGHLPSLTICYQVSDLALPRVNTAFTSPASAEDGNT